MNLSETAKKAINAYGGMETWSNASHIEAEVSVKGLAFVLKGRPFFNHAKIFAKVQTPFCKITPIGKKAEISGILDGNNVRLETQDGKILAERLNARRYFFSLRRNFWWDDLDMAYFANYAFWNYMTLPALLIRADIAWTEVQSGTLEARFPGHLPTHCTNQYFKFDPESGLLIQHNYTAEVISKYANAANVVLEHKSNNGMTYFNSRQVTPSIRDGSALKFPILIDIKIFNFSLT